MYTTSRQAFVPIHFVYKIKRTMSAKFCIYTKCIQNFVKIWGTFVYYKHFLYIHFLYINSDLQKLYIANIMYAICIHNCMQNGSLILIAICFDLFVVHFLVNS